MLTSLSIKNYALIEELDVRFGEGLNIITGETGAGKSILIDALGLILGERANADGVRAGAEKAIVEGVFDIRGNARVLALLQENELEATDELLLRREVSVRGTTRCLVNDSAVTLALMKRIGELLVDLHGQHEHQSLLRAETHIEMLDEYAGVMDLLDEYRAAFRRLRQLSQEIRDLQMREAQAREKLDLYAFQMQEIDAVAPQPGEDEQIETELKILENAEKLVAAAHALYETLYEGENSVHDLLGRAAKQLDELARIDPKLEEQVGECRSAQAAVNELATFIRAYGERAEFNPERLEHLRQRLVALQALKRKYGGTLEAVLVHRERIGAELAMVEHSGAEPQKLVEQRDAQRRRCGELAQRLSERRTAAARTLDNEIVAELASLGIANARFVTAIERRAAGQNGEHDDEALLLGNARVQLHQRGYDEVEFFISTNLGEQPKPLIKVASGGEVSRIMLALKSILAKADRLPVMIFDEIDVGVSGRIAQAVGMSMKNLSRHHQIIAITHLPQIAGLADEHYVVEKVEQKKGRSGRATTTIRKLTLEQRVREVARLLSGAEVTEAGLKSARELMGVK